MTFCKCIRLFFGLILINFLVVLALWACYNYYHHGCFLLLFLVCSIAVSFVNFLFFYLLSRVFDSNKKLRGVQENFSSKIDECFKKIAVSYNMVEASRVSLGIYHDLSSILTASNLALHEISSNYDDKKKLESLIRKNVYINQRANNLIKSFKSQCQKNGEKINFCLSSEIKKTLLILNFYFIKNNIRLDLNLRDDLMVFGDPIKFGQTIINLINNAIESFSEESKSRVIGVSLEREVDRIVIKISDNGVGISPENLEKIFEPFFSLKNEHTNKHCGVGLALVKRIMEDDFGGKIEVFSKLKEGTTFKLYF